MSYPEKILVVDEAHGGLLYFSKDMPNSSLQSGADIATVSIHKSLGGFCGTALVVVNENGKIPMSDVLNAKNALHTSSPSFFLLADVESRVAQMVNVGAYMIDRAYNSNLLF